MKPAALMLCLLSIAAPARAELITLDPTTIPIGTDVSNLFDGVTLQRLTQLRSPTYSPTASPVLIGGAPYYGNSPASFGSYWEMGFGYDGCYAGGTTACSFPFSLLELTFDSPTDYVQIVGDWGSDAPGLRAYDINGNLVSSCDYNLSPSPWNVGCVHQAFTVPGGDHRSVQTVARGQRDIVRIVWAGLYGTSFATGISYQVPEASILMYVGLGAVGILSRRRRVRSGNGARR